MNGMTKRIKLRSACWGTLSATLALALLAPTALAYNYYELDLFDGDPRWVMGTYCRNDGKCVEIKRDPRNLTSDSYWYHPVLIDVSQLGVENPLPSKKATIGVSYHYQDRGEMKLVNNNIHLITDYKFRLDCSFYSDLDCTTISEGSGAVGAGYYKYIEAPVRVEFVSKNISSYQGLWDYVDWVNHPRKQDFIYFAPYGGESLISDDNVFYRTEDRVWFRDVYEVAQRAWHKYPYQPVTPHAEDIQWTADAGISAGWPEQYGSHVFRPMNMVVRQDMAAFLRRLAVKNDIGDAADWIPSDTDWSRFKDVTKDTPHAEDILWLAHAGISTGWKESDGKYTFRGNSTVVRQDMAAFLKRLADKAGRGTGVSLKTDFTDVSSKTPHYQEIQWLGGSGVSTGYKNSNGTWRFEGMTRVYRQDMAAFLHRLDTLITK